MDIMSNVAMSETIKHCLSRIDERYEQRPHALLKILNLAEYDTVPSAERRVHQSTFVITPAEIETVQNYPGFTEFEKLLSRIDAHVDKHITDVSRTVYASMRQSLAAAGRNFSRRGMSMTNAIKRATSRLPHQLSAPPDGYFHRQCFVSPATFDMMFNDEGTKDYKRVDRFCKPFLELTVAKDGDVLRVGVTADPACPDNYDPADPVSHYAVLPDFGQFELGVLGNLVNLIENDDLLLHCPRSARNYEIRFETYFGLVAKGTDRSCQVTW